MREKAARFAGLIKKHRLTLLIFALFLVLAAAMRMQDLKETESFEGIVEREDTNGSTQSQSFSYHVEEAETGVADAVTEELGEQELSLEVSPVQLEREEAFALLRQAVEEWEEAYLGENVSAEEVRSDLILPTSLCDGLVTVRYESSDYDVLNTDGTVTTDTLEAEGELVELTARFSYGDYTQIETTGLLVLPPIEGSAEWVVSELAKEASQTEEDSREETAFSLPDAVGGYRIVWEQGESSTWIFFLLLGGLAVFCLEMRERQQEKERLKKRNARLEREYPQMVDQFAVLLESGMTIRRAWERILLQNHPDKKGPAGKGRADAVYLEEMWITYREMREGRSEREAYERFGSRIGLMPYKRFSSILTQNLSKGTRDIKELLGKESDEALEARKARARKLGEEAGTKLLFPMLVVLLLILLILLVPAITSF